MTQININLEKETIRKETEKAICIGVYGETLRNGDYISFDMWIPKLIVKDNIIPMWFIEKFGKEKHSPIVGFHGNNIQIRF